MATGTNAVSKVRAAFDELGRPLTLAQIKEHTGLLKNEVSMALCYLMRVDQATRVLIPNEGIRVRKNVYQYTHKGK